MNKIIEYVLDQEFYQGTKDYYDFDTSKSYDLTGSLSSAFDVMSGNDLLEVYNYVKNMNQINLSNYALRNNKVGAMEIGDKFGNAMLNAKADMVYWVQSSLYSNAVADVMYPNIRSYISKGYPDCSPEDQKAYNAIVDEIENNLENNHDYLKNWKKLDNLIMEVEHFNIDKVNKHEYDRFGIQQGVAYLDGFDKALKSTKAHLLYSLNKLSEKYPLDKYEKSSQR